jgi:ComF family protein
MMQKIEHMDPEEFKGSLPFSYNNPIIKTMIWNMKYRKNKACFSLAAALIYRSVSCKLVLIPIPISSKRRRERGYNQTEELAKAIMKIDRGKFLELHCSVLLKTKETEHQTRLGKLERQNNLKDTFEVVNSLPIFGRTVLLLDDVITTGSTTREARRILMESGAKEVIIVALAH